MELDGCMVKIESNLNGFNVERKLGLMKLGWD